GEDLFHRSTDRPELRRQGIAREALVLIRRRREDERADLLRVDLAGRRDGGGEQVGGDVGVDGGLERRDERVELARLEEAGRVHLLPKRGDDPLLALSTIEVRRLVARTSEGERLRAVHVLIAARDVEVGV